MSSRFLAALVEDNLIYRDIDIIKVHYITFLTFEAANVPL